MKFIFLGWAVMMTLLPLAVAQANQSAWNLDLTYTADYVSNLKGGVEKKGHFIGNLDLEIDVDLEQSLQWRGAKFFTYVLANHGKAPSESIGDTQIVSNIENGVNTIQLYEVWLQQNLFNEKLSILIGLHDINSEFNTTESSDLFLNSSFGIGAEFAQSGLNGPSTFPYTSLSIRAKLRPTEHSYLLAAIYDGVPGKLGHAHGTQLNLSSEEGYLYALECGLEEKSSYKLAIGTWGYTKAYDEKIETKKARGGYIVFDTAELFETKFFIRYGLTSTKMHDISSNFAGGVVFEKVFHEDDQIGFGFTSAFFSKDYRNELESGKSHETAIEMVYRTQLNDYLAIWPDLQYVINPSADTQITNALVATLRVELSF